MASANKGHTGPGFAPGTEGLGGHDDPKPKQEPKPKKKGSKTAKVGEAASLIAGQPEAAEAIAAADKQKQAKRDARETKKADKRGAKDRKRTAGYHWDNGQGKWVKDETETTTTTKGGDSDSGNALGKGLNGLWKLTNPWREPEDAKKAIKVQMMIGLLVLLLYPLVRKQGMGGYLTIWTKKLVNWVLLFAVFLIGASLGGRNLGRLFAALGALSVLALLLVTPTSQESTIAADLLSKLQKILDPSNPSKLASATQGTNQAWGSLYPQKGERLGTLNPRAPGSGSTSGGNAGQNLPSPDLPSVPNNGGSGGGGGGGASSLFPPLTAPGAGGDYPSGGIGLPEVNPPGPGWPTRGHNDPGN